MTKERVTIVLNIAKKHFSADIEVPLNITVNEFIVGLNSAYATIMCNLQHELIFQPSCLHLINS